MLCWNITLIVKAFAAVQNINFVMRGFHIFPVFLSTVWQHELKQAGLGRTSPLSGYRGLDRNRHGSFRSGCSPELQEGRTEIPKPVLWPKTPVCSSRKRAGKPWRPRRLWDVSVAVGQKRCQLRAWPELLCGRAGSRTPLPSAKGRWTERCSCAGWEAFSLLRSHALCNPAALPRFKFCLAQADQK